MTVHQLLAALREAHQWIVSVEYHNGIFSPLEGEDRDVIFAVGRQRREARREAAVLVWAPRGDPGFRALIGTADQVVWHYDERPAGPARMRRRPVQATLTQMDNLSSKRVLTIDAWSPRPVGARRGYYLLW